jgi:hypothetical protein
MAFLLAYAGALSMAFLLAKAGAPSLAFLLVVEVRIADLD